MRKISERQLAAKRSREWLALDRLVQMVGSQAKVGAHFHVTAQAVQGWYRNGVPVMYCAPLEALVEGRVQCEELREDYRKYTDRPFRRVAGNDIFRPGESTDCLYVSGPMTGIAEHNYPAFHAEAKRLRAAGFEVINPAEINVGPNASWHDYLRADVRAMMRCNGIVMLPGWEDSRGARLEYHIACEIDFKLLRAGETP